MLIQDNSRLRIRARNTPCRVEEIGKGSRLYAVRTPAGHVYRVRVWTETGFRVASCTCAAYHKGLPCYHLFVAAAEDDRLYPRCVA